MKKCIKCSIIKDNSEFYVTKSNKDGLSGSCKTCKKEQVMIYRENNLDITKQRVNKYREKNKEKAQEYNKKWREENKDYKKKKDREYQLKNADKIKVKRKKRYLENKDKELNNNKKWREENKQYKKVKDKEYAAKYKKIRNEKHSLKMKTDILYSISHSIRGMIHKSIKLSGYKKNSKTQEILGCSFDEFLIYLESKFESWMNWENRGLYNGQLNYGWDIDHIIPISSAKSEREIILLNHYTNLQPLCSYTNRYIKKNNI